MEPFLTRRPHDPPGHASTGRRGASCRTSSRPARRRWPRRSASAPRSTTSRRSAWRRSRRTSTSSPPTRSTGSREVPGITLYGPPAERRAGIVLFDLEGHPPARRRAGARLRGRRDPRRPPLLPAADAEARRRRRRTARASTSTRCARRSTSSSTALHTVREMLAMSEFDQLYREVILDHYKSPRSHGTIESPDAHADGTNPLCGDEVSIDVALRDGETIERRQVLGPRLRDLAGRDVDADRDGRRQDGRRGRRARRRTSCSRRWRSR